MNTNLNDNVNTDFSSFFEFAKDDDSAELQHEARMIMYRFLSEIEKSSSQEKGLKKRLAKAIKKSPSFITQLFNGDKLINLITLAKFQKALDIKFKITAYPKDSYDYLCSTDMVKNIFIIKEWKPNADTAKPKEAQIFSYTQLIEDSEAILS